MVIKATLISGLSIAALSAIPAFAQSNSTIIRETVPTQSKPIIANSPEDLALQEEIRKIRAYNAHVDSLVGVSGTVTQSEATTITAPYTSSTSNSYAGSTIELFDTAPTTTYSSVTTVPSTTIIERQPVAGATTIYRVAEGDTLYNISKRNCLSVEEIQNQNGLSGSNIGLGQVLTIPASKCGTIANAGFSTTTTIPAQTVTTSFVNSKTYAVLPKDSLYSIGRRYCVSANDIASANSITTATIIKPGQILQLPAGACIK